MNVRQLRFCFVVVAITGIAVTAHADTHLSPGLWQEQVSIKTDNAQADAAMAQLQQKMATMPPEQRKQIEQMMASHGVGTGSMTNSLRICISKEQSERDMMPDHNANCSRRSFTRSGNVVKFSFACEGGHAPVSGQGTATLDSPTSFHVATDADTAVQGKPTHMHSDVVGNFVSSDCGDVKPVDMH